MKSQSKKATYCRIQVCNILVNAKLWREYKDQWVLWTVKGRECGIGSAQRDFRTEKMLCMMLW